MKIGDVARQSGVSVRSLRHYEGVGLIRSTRGRNGYRDFDAGAVQLVRRIRRLIALGFSTSEIAAFLPGIVGEVVSDCVAVTAAHRAKLAEIERQIAGLERQKNELLAALRAAAGREACLPQHRRARVERTNH